MYIVLEGADGSGKTTICQQLAKKLKKMGYTVLLTREPGSTIIGEKIRELVLEFKELEYLPELFLFITDRCCHYEKMKKERMNHDIIISDRNFFSSFVYQGFGHKVDLDIIAKVHDILERQYFDTMYPDYLFYLYASPEELRRRVESRSNMNKFDKKDEYFLKDILDGYEKVIEKYKRKIKITKLENTEEPSIMADIIISLISKDLI